MTFLAFRESTRKIGTHCEVASCDQEASLRYPTPRRMCLPHIRVWTSPGFHGCGCGPQSCAACARHLGLGRRVLLVGERENRPGWEADDALHLGRIEALRRQGGSAAVLSFLESVGALRWGTSRKRIADLGLRWDNAINLLGPSARPGQWNPVLARSAATAARPAAMEKYDAVILLGVRVAKAWGEAEPARARVANLPHPSGRNRLWNNPACAADSRLLVEEIYADSSGRAAPQVVLP